MEIVADRFLRAAGGRVMDLATSAEVLLRISAGRDAREQRAWSARCEAFHKVRHPWIAWLIDYGGLGESHRFEAWVCGAPWTGATDALRRTLGSAERFLFACNVTTGELTDGHLHESDGRAVLVPGDGAGYRADGVAVARTEWSIANCGIEAIDRRADRCLDDLFASLSGARPHVVSIWGPRGSGRTTAVLRAARVARVHGLVPIASRMLEQLDVRALADRQLCVIDDRGGSQSWTAVLKGILGSPHAHVVLRTALEEPRDIHALRLDEIPATVLSESVRPGTLDGAAREVIRRMAAASNGSPGRFVNLMWGRRPAAVRYASRSRRDGFGRVAEVALSYGPRSDAEGEHMCESQGEHPPSDLAALRRRVTVGVGLLRRGRHAPGERQLRQALGGFARRRDWTQTREVARLLAAALRRRGDPRGASSILEDAYGRAADKGDPGFIDAAILSGQCWIDLARLAEAESAIATAVAAARQSGDGLRLAAASLALSRCLFWKGHYAEAASLASGVVAGPARQPDLLLAVRATMALARASIGLGDLARALLLVREGIDHARRADDDGVRGSALCASAFVRLAVGDADAAADDARAAIDAGRRSHDPMVSVRGHLLHAECERRHGRTGAAARVVARLRRVVLPPVLQARADLLQSLLTEPADSDSVSRYTRRSGLAALTLFAGPVLRPFSVLTESASELLAILHLCQTADDESRVLAELCVRLRGQLRAAAVAVAVQNGASLSWLAHDGARVDPEVAVRAMTSGIDVAPHRLHDRLEAAAPVRYGGVVIGAVVARWPMGTPYDLSGAVSLLAMSATAAAPLVSGALKRPSTAPAIDLIGVTTSMVALRDAIERAARAPFAVLVEGESGSGKELVAKAVHRLAHQRDRPFCTLNCAALPDDLIEAELFGHTRGAFTGAIGDRPGVFEEAHGGTLFLDEVGELSPRAQAKLLRVIQEGELRRLGENTARRVDVRIVSATNRDLRHEVAAGRFRLDLLYRLDVIRLAVPPLRERREDIALLADRFWHEAADRVGSRAVLSAATTAALVRYDWPGNVRELQNVLAALAVRAQRRGVIMPAALPPQFAEARPESCRLDEARRTFEARFVRAALVRTGGHRGRAAAELGVTRQGLTKLMSRLAIDAPGRLPPRERA